MQEHYKQNFRLCAPNVTPTNLEFIRILCQITKENKHKIQQYFGQTNPMYIKIYNSVYKIYEHENNYHVDGLLFDPNLVCTSNVDEGYLTMTEAENVVRDELEEKNERYIYMLQHYVLCLT